jgi:hypothetical protein
MKRLSLTTAVPSGVGAAEELEEARRRARMMPDEMNGTGPYMEPSA